MQTPTQTPPTDRRRRPSVRTKIGALSTTALAAAGGLGVAGVAGVATAAPAGAACNGGDRDHSVNTFRGDHHLQGSARVSNVSGGRERWCDIRTYEGGGSSIWPNVCDYQGFVGVYNPDGSSANRSHMSSFHSGCSIAGWFYHDPLEDVYAEDKRFTTKWRSDATNGDWQTIGTLVD